MRVSRMSNSEKLTHRSVSTSAPLAPKKSHSPSWPKSSPIVAAAPASPCATQRHKKHKSEKQRRARSNNTSQRNVPRAFPSELPSLLDRRVSLECRHVDAGGCARLARSTVDQLAVLARARCVHGDCTRFCPDTARRRLCRSNRSTTTAAVHASRGRTRSSHSCCSRRDVSCKSLDGAGIFVRDWLLYVAGESFVFSVDVRSRWS